MNIIIRRSPRPSPRARAIPIGYLIGPGSKSETPRPLSFDLGPSGVFLIRGLAQNLWTTSKKVGCTRAGINVLTLFFFSLLGSESENHDGQCQMPSGREPLLGRLCFICRPDHLRVSFLTAVFGSNPQSILSYVQPGRADGRAGGVLSRVCASEGGRDRGECTCFSFYVSTRCIRYS